MTLKLRRTDRNLNRDYLLNHFLVSGLLISISISCKRFNFTSKNNQCHAIRDAQMSEKAEIARDLQQEEERLDAMMEVHRLNGVKQAEINEELKQKQRREGAREILDQIKLNTENKLLEEEKKNAESQALIT